MKEVPFWSKVVYKSVRVCTSERSIPVRTFVDYIRSLPPRGNNDKQKKNEATKCPFLNDWFKRETIKLKRFKTGRQSVSCVWPDS